MFFEEVRLLRELLVPGATPAKAPPAAPAPVPAPAVVAKAPKAPRVGTTQLKVVSAGGDAGDIADFFVQVREKASRWQLCGLFSLHFSLRSLKIFLRSL